MEIPNIMTEYGVTQLEYYQQNTDFVVVEKRVYYYIFKNNGQIPTFQKARELEYDRLPSGYATYVGRIRKEKYQSQKEVQKAYRERQKAFWEPSQEVQAWLENIELTPAEALERIFAMRDWDKETGTKEPINHVLLYEILELRQCGVCDAWKSSEGQGTCEQCEENFCDKHLDDDAYCPSCQELKLEEELDILVGAASAWLEKNQWFCFLPEGDKQGLYLDVEGTASIWADMSMWTTQKEPKYIVIPATQLSLWKVYDESIDEECRLAEVEDEEDLSEEKRQDIKDSVFDFEINQSDHLRSLIRDYLEEK
ncbi:MAG: hypothetical protein ACFFC7_20125 [Candidatus Hermodarchaeota archaeon]